MFSIPKISPCALTTTIVGLSHHATTCSTMPETFTNLVFLSITFFSFSIFSWVILYFKWVVGIFFVERKLPIIFELIMGLLKKKRNCFNFFSSSYPLTFVEEEKKWV
jgi:hypothetical protein